MMLASIALSVFKTLSLAAFSPSSLSASIGGSIPIVFSYYSEFLAQEKRGEHLSWLCMFWMFGGIYAAAMAWAIIPHYGEKNPPVQRRAATAVGNNAVLWETGEPFSAGRCLHPLMFLLLSQAGASRWARPISSTAGASLCWCVPSPPWQPFALSPPCRRAPASTWRSGLPMVVMMCESGKLLARGGSRMFCLNFASRMGNTTRRG